MWLILAMGGIASFLLASTLTLAVAPVLAFAHRSRAQIARVLLAHLREEAPAGFAQALEPPAASALRNLFVLAESKEDETTDLWIRLVVGLTPNKVGGPAAVARIQQASMEELDKEVLRIQEKISRLNAVGVLEYSARWLRWTYLRLAWVGLKNHFLPISNSALEIVGLSATSFTVLGLLVSTVGASAAALSAPAPPDVLLSYLGTGATLGGFVGMLMGVARFFRMARTALSDANASWWLMALLFGNNLAIIVAVMVGVLWSQAFGRNPVPTSTADSLLPPWALSTAAIAAGLLYFGFAVLLIKAMLAAAIRATSWPQRVFAWGLVSSTLLLGGAIAALMLNWQVVFTALVWALFVSGALSLVVPPLISFGTWIFSRARRTGRPVYLGLSGIIVVWLMLYMLFGLVALIAVFLASTLLGAAPSASVMIGANFVALAASVLGGWRHHRRNVYRNSRRKLELMGDSGDRGRMLNDSELATRAGDQDG